MGAIKSFMYGIKAFFIMGFGYLILQPIMYILFEYCRAMGGESAQIAELAHTVFAIYPVLFIAVVLLSSFIGATKEEEGSRWTR